MTIRQKQFINALKGIEKVIENSVVRVEDVKYLLDSGWKLTMAFEEMEKSRTKWRIRAETAEDKLKYG